MRDTQIKTEERRIRWRDKEIEEAEEQTETSGSPWNSPDEIHYYPQLINKEWDCLWWRTDALNAGGKCETSISLQSAPKAWLCVLLWRFLLYCIPSEDGYCFIKGLQNDHASRRGTVGKFWNLWVIQDLPSSLLWGSRASCTLPASLREQLPQPWCELCNSGV